MPQARPYYNFHNLKSESRKSLAALTGFVSIRSFSQHTKISGCEPTDSEKH